jgi:hypothetical protein
VGARIYLRSGEHLAKLIAPWKVLDEAPLETYPSIGSALTPEQLRENVFRITGLFAGH